MSKPKPFITTITLLFALSGGPVYGADPEDLEDLLEARWFDIEMVVFERLDVLDANSSETLALTKPRRWPNHLARFFDAPVDVETVTAIEYDFETIAPGCLGYPELAEEDPLHPLLQPVTVFSDETLRAEAELAQAEMTATLADKQDAAAASETALEPTDAELEALDTLLPQNTPALVMTPYLQLLADVAAFEASLFAGAFQTISERLLTNDVKALNRQRHLRPVLHTRWRQPVPPRDAPISLYLSAEVAPEAPLTEAGYAKLEGYVSVTVGRYLHFAPHLWYHADTLGMQPIALPAAHNRLPQVQDGYMEMDDSRRMRSGELHYIDHPKFSVLVRIDPVAFPEEILAAWDALEESDGS